MTIAARIAVALGVAVGSACGAVAALFGIGVLALGVDRHLPFDEALWVAFVALPFLTAAAIKRSFLVARETSVVGIGVGTILGVLVAVAISPSTLADSRAERVRFAAVLCGAVLGALVGTTIRSKRRTPEAALLAERECMHGRRFECALCDLRVGQDVDPERGVEQGVAADGEPPRSWRRS